MLDFPYRKFGRWEHSTAALFTGKKRPAIDAGLEIAGFVAERYLRFGRYRSVEVP
jgi:hypothetical protein